MFDEAYLAEALSIGLPHDFEPPHHLSNRSRNNMHIELTMMSNLKMFY